MGHRISTTDDIGLVIRARRRELGETQEQFARRVGKVQPLISDIERGNAPNMSIATLLEVFALAGVHLEATGPAPSNSDVPIQDTDGDLALEFPDDESHGYVP